MRLDGVLKKYVAETTDAHSDGCSEGYRFKASIKKTANDDIVIRAKLFNMDTLDELNIGGLPIKVNGVEEKLDNKGKLIIKKPVVDEDNDSITVHFPRSVICLRYDKLELE